MPQGSNEVFPRILVAKALGESCWNLLYSHQVRIELNTDTSRTRTDALFQSTLHRAFNGNL